MILEECIRLIFKESCDNEYWDVFKYYFFTVFLIKCISNFEKHYKNLTNQFEQCMLLYVELNSIQFHAIYLFDNDILSIT